MVENEVYAIIAETLFRNHNKMVVKKFGIPPYKFNGLPDRVKEEIDIQATEITKAIADYLAA
jgi:hypothetical protein